jgi:hypothetical protein
MLKKYPLSFLTVINFVFGLTVFVEWITIIVAWRGGRWQLLTSSYDKKRKTKVH